MSRCPRCHYLVIDVCAVCTSHAAVTRVIHVPHTLAGQTLPALVQSPGPSRGRQMGRPVQWTRERCLAAGAVWVHTHPARPLYASDCRATQGLPTPKILYTFFGTLAAFREALGLPAGRAVQARQERTL